MYTSREKIESQSLIPANLPWSESEIEEKFAVWITDATREIDSTVGSDYPALDTGLKFEAYPNTPTIVALVAGWLVASYALQSLGVVARAGEELPMWAMYREMAEKKLVEIRMRKIDVLGVASDDAGEELDTGTPSPVTVAARPNTVTVGGWDTGAY